MSSNIRQSNLFSSEDYRKVFKAYSFINYTAYDFDTLKQAMIDYIQTYYPEDFNDYIESSEFIAIIELLAYFGTSLAFRTDLNSRENFIDTAERRESVIRLAQMVNYVPRRNIPASGLLKIASVETDQPLTDANGVSINNVPVFWNDPNNPDWFDQFIQICNASFSSINPFGRPTKSGTIGSIPTDLYQLNNVLRLNVAYPFSATVNGQQYPFDICNPNFVTNETIFERDPSPTNSFNFIYRNDGLGVASANTGFFLYFKQGNLINIDTNFEFPVPNRIFPIEIENINQFDVYVQETNQAGDVINQWVKVPALAGENIIYNSIQFSERNIFDVISGANDTVSVRFSDGNFGNIPTGLFRFWVRISANENLVIRPDAIQGVRITIPYIASNAQQYNLTITFNLEQTISNAAPSETNDQVKLRAPEIFSTQSRMVNGSDYNVLPLIFGNQIAKIQAINRTSSGQSRYIDLNDPTGFHRDLIIFGQDGALYRDNENILVEVVKDVSNESNIDTIFIESIEEVLRNKNVSQFFYDEYLSQFERKIRVNVSGTKTDGYSLLDVGVDPGDTLNPGNRQPLIWKTSPATSKNTTGYFVNTISSTTAVPLQNTLNTTNIPTGTYQAWGFIKSGAVLNMFKPNPNPALELASYNTTSVTNVIQYGLPVVINTADPYATVGPVEFGSTEPVNANVKKIYPVFRTTFTDSEITEIIAARTNGISFWLYYDLIQDKWHTSTNTPVDINVPFEYPDPIPGSILSNWASSTGGLLYVNILSDNEASTTTYSISARGRVYVFESYRDVRFYWEPNQVVIDNASGLALQDTIEIMPLVNTNETIDNNDPPPLINPPTALLQNPVNFNISGVFTQNDGYVDTAKVQVSLVDINNNGIADNPAGFDEIVSLEDRVVFEYYNNELTGYQSSRPWIANWATTLGNTATDYYVYFPVNTLVTPPYTSLYGAPYISDTLIIDPLNPEDTPGATIVYMDSADLIFINNIGQLAFDAVTFPQSIANQVTAFFNNDETTYPWITNITNISNKIQLITNYFINKSYLISDSAPGYGEYFTLKFQETSNLLDFPTGKILTETVDEYHYDKNGKVFTQNTTIPDLKRFPLYFKWSHYAPIDQRVDPAATNIIDMIAITYSYYQDMLNWKNNNGTLSTMPAPPTTEELRIQFQELNQYKMVSDNMIWNSGTFKILFGPQAAPELQATFKVVKSASTTISDSEVKTQVIQAIDNYFDIINWDFGEKFFYTELAAYIHQQLAALISSVVIVPSNSNSLFGNLFEIVASPTEIFMSTATVNNVQIVANLTNQNLRI